MKRSTPLKSKTRMRKVSDKRKREGKVYSKLRREYLQEHPKCEAQGCVLPATELHHVKGRGKFFLDPQWFMATCEFHHRLIHGSPMWAREKGYLVYGKDGK